jgi:hypothetical protein
MSVSPLRNWLHYADHHRLHYADQRHQSARCRLGAGLAALRQASPLRHQFHGQRTGVVRSLDEAGEVRQGMAG